jgi:hypothetical protein
MQILSAIALIHLGWLDAINGIAKKKAIAAAKAANIGVIPPVAASWIVRIAHIAVAAEKPPKYNPIPKPNFCGETIDKAQGIPPLKIALIDKPNPISNPTATQLLGLINVRAITPGINPKPPKNT